MELRWKPFDRREPPLGAIYGVVMAGCAALAVAWVWLDLPRMACPLRRVAGLPCPTCGSTRLVESLLRGDIEAAFASNPLVFLTLGTVVLWAVASTLRRAFSWPGPQLVWTRRDGLWVRVAVVVVVLFGWAYVIVNHG